MSDIRPTPPMGGVNQHIHHAMPTARPSLADAVRIPDCLKNPDGGEFGASKAHREALEPRGEHVIAPIMGTDGLFYDNTAGTSGVASDGQNWGRLAIAVRRWALPLSEDMDFITLIS